MLSVKFNTEMLNTEQKEILVKFFNDKISELKLLLDLSTLEGIIITEKFTQDVIGVQREYGSREIGHTDRDDGLATAVAKVIRTPPGESLKQTIIFNVNIIVGLFNPEFAQISFHYVHHELCHVHDNLNQNKLSLISTSREKELNKLEHNLAYNAEPIWAEYIAVRLSVGTLAYSNILDLPTNDLYVIYLKDLISSCEKNLDKAIEEYRFDGNIGKLFKYLQEETSLLFKIAATTQGYIDGLNISERKICDLINEQISNTYFYKSWLMQWKALKKLFDSYPKWNDIYEILELGESIKTCWSELGIEISFIEEQDGIYLNVPIKDKE